MTYLFTNGIFLDYKIKDHVIKFKATFLVVIKIFFLLILLGTGVANTKLYD